MTISDEQAVAIIEGWPARLAAMLEAEKPTTMRALRLVLLRMARQLAAELERPDLEMPLYKMFKKVGKLDTPERPR